MEPALRRGSLEAPNGLRGFAGDKTTGLHEPPVLIDYTHAVGKGNHIPNLSMDTPVHEAAAITIGPQIERIIRLLPKAMDEAGADSEVVHQLRVSCRRASTVLRLFKPCLSKHNRRSLKSALDKIRSAAGAIRDWDVFLELVRELRDQTTEVHLPATDFLLGYAEGRRAAGLQQLAAQVKSPSSRLERICLKGEELFRPPKESDDDRLGNWLGRAIESLTKGLASDLSLDDSSPQHLHRTRIHAKRLRYVLELHARLCGTSEANELSTTSRKIQDAFGELRDLQVAEATLTDIEHSVSKTEPGTLQRMQAGFASLRQDWKSKRIALESQIGALRIEWNQDQNRTVTEPRS